MSRPSDLAKVHEQLGRLPEELRLLRNVLAALQGSESPSDTEIRTALTNLKAIENVSQEILQRAREVERLVLRMHEEKTPAPPGAGAFSSGYSDTADRAEDLLGELGFGEASG